MSIISVDNETLPYLLFFPCIHAILEDIFSFYRSEQRQENVSLLAGEDDHLA